MSCTIERLIFNTYKGVVYYGFNVNWELLQVALFWGGSACFWHWDSYRPQHMSAAEVRFLTSYRSKGFLKSGYLKPTYSEANTSLSFSKALISLTNHFPWVISTYFAIFAFSGFSGLQYCITLVPFLVKFEFHIWTQ